MKKWRPYKKDDDNDEWDDYPRRGPFDGMSPFNGLFSESDEFDRMERRMDAIFRKAFGGEPGEPGQGGPFVYGYSVRTGPDGKPQVREFGNLDPKVGRRLTGFPEQLKVETGGDCPTCSPTSELTTCGDGDDLGSIDRLGKGPLTDMIECDDYISVTIELPGIDKEDIDLRAAPESLTVNVDTPARKYNKTFNLSCKVNPNKIRATYKNGILDITLERKDKSKKKGKRIKIN